VGVGAGSATGGASGAALAGRGAVRSIPPGFRSKAQASATATGKPSPSASTVTERSQSPRCSACSSGSMTCSSAKVTRP
jgi:hypothetical protein